MRRLRKMTIHEEDPNVVRLHLYLPKMHRVIFNTHDDPLTILIVAKFKELD